MRCSRRRLPRDRSVTASFGRWRDVADSGTLSAAIRCQRRCALSPGGSAQPTPYPTVAYFAGLKIEGRACGRVRNTMKEPADGRVTELLVDWSSGDQRALSELLPLVYGELRRLADRQLRGERQNHTLQRTALVHEAYLRLINQKYVNWQGRAHFIGLAAQLMRRILIDHARETRTDRCHSWVV